MGHSATFNATADGYVVGEGCGAVAPWQASFGNFERNFERKMLTYVLTYLLAYLFIYLFTYLLESIYKGFLFGRNGLRCWAVRAWRFTAGAR